jgi:SnoaL-like domain
MESYQPMKNELFWEAAKHLAAWHDMVAAQNFVNLPSIVATDAVFRSPVAFTPYPGKAAVVGFLRAALATFEDFRYDREFVCRRQDVVLEFAARVRDKELKGVDLIRFDDDGLIKEFEVMLRPASALAAVAEEMSARTKSKTTRPV